MVTTVYPCGEGQLAAVPGVQRWQYVRLQVSVSYIVSSDALVGQLGRDGWELTSTARDYAFLHLWFKRQV